MKHITLKMLLLEVLDLLMVERPDNLFSLRIIAKHSEFLDFLRLSKHSVAIPAEARAYANK